MSLLIPVWLSPWFSRTTSSTLRRCAPLRCLPDRHELAPGRIPRVPTSDPYDPEPGMSS
jgi:hypothetical protein